MTAHLSFVPLAFIDSMGGPEMLLIFVLVLVLFGGKKMPEFARGLGRALREFKKATATVEHELKRAIEEEPAPAPRPTLPPPATVAASAPAATASVPMSAAADVKPPQT